MVATKKAIEDRWCWNCSMDTPHELIIYKGLNSYSCKYCRHCEMYENGSDRLISDGFGSAWSIVCPECEKPIMQVVRPGKVQCPDCG